MESYEWPTVYIQTSNGCTHSCKMCPHVEARRQIEYEVMSLDILNRVVEGMKEIPEIVVGLQGEPLQDPHLIEKLDLIKRKCPKAKLVLDTSALDLTIPLAVAIRDAGVDRVRVNVWEKPNAARVRHFHYLGIEVELIVVVSQVRRFSHELLYREYGQQCIITEIPIDNGRGFVNSFVSLNNRELGEREPCSRPFRELCVNVQGKVVACQNDYTEDSVMGDAVTGSVEKIWKSKEFENFRARHISDDRESTLKGTLCEGCTFAR